MSGLGALIIGTMLLAAEVPSEPESEYIMWDAQYFVVVRGTVSERDSSADGTFRATVIEAPGSGVGVSEQPGQRDTEIKLGESFEHKFGFFWGGTSRPGDPPQQTPRFVLKLVGNGHCFVEEVPQVPGGVSIIELGAVELVGPCAP